MSPSTDHEREIARIVDSLSAQGKLSPDSIHDVVASLDFVYSKDEGRFMVKYVLWRMDHPIRRKQ